MTHNWKLQLQQAYDLGKMTIINDLAWLLVNIGVVNDPSEVSGISYTTPDGVTFLLGQQVKGDDVLFVLQIDRVGSATQNCYLPSTDNDMRILSHLDRSHFFLRRDIYIRNIASCVFDDTHAPAPKRRIAE